MPHLLLIGRAIWLCVPTDSRLHQTSASRMMIAGSDQMSGSNAADGKSQPEALLTTSSPPKTMLRGRTP